MTETLAERAREALRDHPFLVTALRAGVVNYAAAARFLDLDSDADVEAAATALRRYADDREAYAVESRDARVTMESGLGRAEDAPDGLLSVNGVGFAPGEGTLTGVIATGDVDAAALGSVLGRLATDGIEIEAAGVAGDGLLVVVSRRDGPDALRAVEAALAAVPTTA
ncbi:DUF7523 family protein [Halarchaeum nitratireducens]|uniref:Uncharacterized protein n=1 Tax=Halarchaeum nitratireducens TaxID=489913 RepID=A0A830GD32_9EURY|nr:MULTISPECIES: hypothetical protein [Halarchaeum]MBP2250905.1 hypothetical protein [Halarchaeum solikamskense]GGN19817.1 hypothetical protein GCM10009021_21130 [Halarchaeum nitratireducens]